MADKKIAGVILAAGKGTRLKPFTDHTPKPLAEVHGVSLLELNLQKAYDLVDEFVIVVNWLQDKIIQKIGNNYKGKRVIYAEQKSAVGGTLDAFRCAVNNLQNPSDFTYFIINSDNIYGEDFYRKIESHLQTSPDTACLLAKKFTDHSLLSAYGVFETDEKGNFLRVVEKPQTYVSDLVNIGLYYLPSNIINYLNKPVSIKQAEVSEEYITDLFNSYSQNCPIKIISSVDDYFSITTMQDLQKANQK